MTAMGEVAVHRLYVACPSCRENTFPADARLGVVARLTARARKIACLFGTGWGFAAAASHLGDVCGWSISAQSLKRLCYAEASEVETWRTEEEATTSFSEAEGSVEFQVDGTMVNTTEEGWKEIRVGAFLKRPAGEPGRADTWGSRIVPAPTARSVRVVIASAEDFAATWHAWANSLGIVLMSLITVLADGAKWIWHQSRENLAGSRGVLDIFHVLEHVAAATRAVYGEGTGTALAWKDSAAQALLRDGWLGLCDWVGRWREQCPADLRHTAESASDQLIGYLIEHTEHLGYCERLAKGETIGSGQIEGACKYVIGRRLKRTGGRWRKENAVKMGILCSTHYAGDWDVYWESSLACAV